MASFDTLFSQAQSFFEPGEAYLVAIGGSYEKNGWTRDGILVATNKRVIFYGKKLFGFDMEIFDYKSISSVEVTKELLGFRVTIYSSGNSVVLKWIHSELAIKFCDVVRNMKCA